MVQAQQEQPHKQAWGGKLSDDIRKHLGSAWSKKESDYLAQEGFTPYVYENKASGSGTYFPTVVTKKVGGEYIVVHRDGLVWLAKPDLITKGKNKGQIRGWLISNDGDGETFGKLKSSVEKFKKIAK